MKDVGFGLNGMKETIFDLTGMVWPGRNRFLYDWNGGRQAEVGFGPNGIA
jgi:hypothetical protein